MIKFLHLFLSILFVCCPTSVKAEDINLSLNVQSKDDYVRVVVENRSLTKVHVSRVVLEFNNQQYQQKSVDIPSFSQRAFEFFVQYPKLEGSYPLKTEVFYYNQEKELSLIDIGYYNYNLESLLSLDCPEQLLYVRDRASVIIPKSQYDMAIVMPNAIKVNSINGQEISFENSEKEFSIDGKYYLVYEAIINNQHQSKICKNRLLAFKSNKKFSFFSDQHLFLILILSLFTLTHFARYTNVYNKFLISRSAFSLAIYTWFYLFLRNAGRISDFLINNLSAPYTPLKQALISQYKFLYFQGSDYDAFFEYAADYFVLYFIFLNYFVLKYILRLDLRNDKYVHLQAYLLSKLSFFYLPFDKVKAKVASLALLVKAFYVPLFISWLFQKVVSLNIDYHRVQWNIESLSSFLISIFIFVDVLIFCFGYLVESTKLKNVIKSVEPTFFGWFICLICYPPFNQFLFFLIDKPLEFGNLTESTIQISSKNEVVSTIVTILITVLWFIYVWASVALGYKGSNLTNRGIVQKGPYRYLRHPAYVSKLCVWVITSIFLAKMNILLVLALIVIYSLRAWTEERHLSTDPDYLEYKKQVPWMFIPKVF